MTYRPLAFLVLSVLSLAGCGDGGTDADGSQCATGCEATLVAACDVGPATQEECETDCEDLLLESCGADYQALLDCSDGAEVTCDSESGIPIVADCATEQETFIACLNGG